MINGEVISQMLVIIGALTILVNIITEVMKTALPTLSTSKSINIFVVGLSEGLTIIAGVAYFAYNKFQLDWIAIIALIVVGFLVAYSAMFGYDKLLSYFEKKEKKND